MIQRIVPALTVVVLIIACASTGKLTPERLDTIVERCRAEQERVRPRGADMRNLSTEERNKKRTEQQRYGVERLTLYKILAKYKQLYLQFVAADGRCAGDGCDELVLLQRQVADRCPDAAAALSVSLR